MANQTFYLIFPYRTLCWQIVQWHYNFDLPSLWQCLSSLSFLWMLMFTNLKMCSCNFKFKTLSSRVSSETEVGITESQHYITSCIVQGLVLDNSEDINFSLKLTDFIPLIMISFCQIFNYWVFDAHHNFTDSKIQLGTIDKYLLSCFMDFVPYINPLSPTPSPSVLNGQYQAWWSTRQN